MELNLDNLKVIRVLGRGAMGTVFLVIDDNSSSSTPPFALKVIEKNSPSARPDSDRRARLELSLLSQFSHPHLPSLIGSSESNSLLAYAFPFCPGGDLNSLRYSLSDHIFSHSAIRFYLSEILTALSHLHSLHIVYRDLKPENILIKSDGHVVLSDFDLSRHLNTFATNSDYSTQSNNAVPKQTLPSHRRNLTRTLLLSDNVSSYITSQLKKAKSARVSPVSKRRSSISTVERSHSFVGTEEYVAPEIVNGEGHDYTVDFWGLGILAYEMAYGKTPFKGRNRKETFRNVVTKNVEFVGRQRSELTDLIGRLLVKDVGRRLGGMGGVEEVKGHPFFKGVKWDMVGEVQRPPYFATFEELEEAVTGSGEGNCTGVSVREYYERVRKPEVTGTSLTEF